MAATVPVEKAGDASPLLEQAHQIGVPDPAPTKPADTGARQGSFESFMGTFGRSR